MSQFLKNKIENIINTSNNDDKNIAFQLKQLLYESEYQNSSIKESKSLKSIIIENRDFLNSGSNINKTIKSGFDDIDKTLGGFRLGEFVVIGGRPSMGKTQLLVNLALNISENIPVLFFTLDLSELFITFRMMSSTSKIAVDKMIQQDLSNQEIIELAAAENKLKNHKLFINDSFIHTMTDFISECKKQIEENDVKVIFVDSLQMMSSNKSKNNRELEISYISCELKKIAKEFNVCIIASSQLSSSLESRKGDKRPILSDLRDLGPYEQETDKVIFIYRPAYYGFYSDEEGNDLTNLAELIVAKNRNGHVGVAKARIDKSHTHFSSF